VASLGRYGVRESGRAQFKTSSGGAEGKMGPPAPGEAVLAGCTAGRPGSERCSEDSSAGGPEREVRLCSAGFSVPRRRAEAGVWGRGGPGRSGGACLANQNTAVLASRALGARLLFAERSFS
jgi:hypothetical protein